MSIRYNAVVLVLLAFGLAPMGRAEVVDNLQYQSWRYCKPGTKVVIRQETSAQNKTLVQEVTRTLLEITPEKIIVDLVVDSDLSGTKHQDKAREEIPARIDSAQQRMPAGVRGTLTEKDKQTIEVAGKKLECRVFEFTGESPQGKVAGTTWQSLEIPGGMAKLEMLIQSRFTIKMTVTSIQAAP